VAVRRLARGRLIRFTDPIHLLASVNRFSTGGVKGLRPPAGRRAPELPVGFCHGVAGWHGGRDN